ncbi:hypothetical protein F441_13122 [Phytophthora nicotianae CJ01A1]|uniref:Uncharacterized protein n=4 Tax=Phytophthora nicotianae TaxID=4792 RepID=V9EQT7_PHYNI|nr:hypothetical protein F443_13169 [Phytophthora nicotianae P1569]ETM30482.1 hypothetical protein L914_21843 [Phytophthora nicotianae]ETO70264.1 hypothetical protein F444_13241 [Phytophthora nicotianae P1976]ETP11366.1 hypothetical protein F441_13122 [Phytophthora nicotianae CJ01A1]
MLNRIDDAADDIMEGAFKVTGNQNMSSEQLGMLRGFLELNEHFIAVAMKRLLEFKEEVSNSSHFHRT